MKYRCGHRAVSLCVTPFSIFTNFYAQKRNNYKIYYILFKHFLMWYQFNKMQGKIIYRFVQCNISSAGYIYLQ